jgi:hypothetical protein
VVVLFHPTIEEEGTTPLDAAARFMQMATDSSKLNIAGSNIVFACELSRARLHPKFSTSTLTLNQFTNRCSPRVSDGISSCAGAYPQDAIPGWTAQQAQEL